LSHAYFQAGGRDALAADERSHSGSSGSSGLLLNLSAVLLELCSPLCAAPDKFVGKIEAG
jgi:hypothetical protein